MNIKELKLVTEYMWGSNPVVKPTIIDGIYDTQTDRHGGYLVNIEKIPQLTNYGEKTNISNIKAFEEDYEALKVLWVFPKLINEPEKAHKWLTPEQVIKYESGVDFLEDFLACDLYIDGLEKLIVNYENDDVLVIGCKIMANAKTNKIIEKCKELEGLDNYSDEAFDLVLPIDRYREAFLRYIPNYSSPLELDYSFSLNELKEIKQIVENYKKERGNQEIEELL